MNIIIPLVFSISSNPFSIRVRNCLIISLLLRIIRNAFQAYNNSYELHNGNNEKYTFSRSYHQTVDTL